MLGHLLQAGGCAYRVGEHLPDPPGSPDYRPRDAAPCTRAHVHRVRPLVGHRAKYRDAVRVARQALRPVRYALLNALDETRYGIRSMLHHLAQSSFTCYLGAGHPCQILQHATVGVGSGLLAIRVSQVLRHGEWRSQGVQ